MKIRCRKITVVCFTVFLWVQLMACTVGKGTENSKVGSTLATETEINASTEETNTFMEEADMHISAEETGIDASGEGVFQAREIKGFFLCQTSKELMELYAGEKTGNLATGNSSEKGQGIEIWFAKKEKIQNIELEFYSRLNYAQNFKIEFYDGVKWKELVKEEEFNPMLDSRFCLEVLEEEVKVEGIRFLADTFAGTDYLLLKGIRFNVKSEKEGGKLYATAHEVVTEILENYENYEMTDFQRCLFLMDWIDSNVEPGVVDTDPYITLKTGMGACGNKSVLMAALAKECGLESRYINFYNWPYPGGGHSMVEIYYQDQWHLFDPYYCAYYVKNPGERNNRVDPEVASFQELRDNPQLADTGAVVMNVTEEFFLTLERNGER